MNPVSDLKERKVSRKVGVGGGGSGGDPADLKDYSCQLKSGLLIVSDSLAYFGNTSDQRLALLRA